MNAVILPTNRKFGFFFTAVFSCLSLYFAANDSLRISYLFGFFAVSFLLATSAKPDLLLPLNKCWMHLGLLLGKLATPIVMALIFFGIFTPMAILMRLFGRDELRIKIKNRKPNHTFWIRFIPSSAGGGVSKSQF